MANPQQASGIKFVTEKAHATPVDHLEYISEMTMELRKMALGMRAYTLAQLLEVVMLEANLQKELHIEVEQKSSL